MRKISFAALLLASLLGATATAAPAPALSPPVGPWNVEFADNMCVLSRPYNAGGKNVVLFLHPSIEDDSLEITIGTPTDRVADYKGGEAILGSPGGPRTRSDFTAYSTAQMRMVRIDIPSHKLALTELGDTLAVDVKEEGRFLLDIAGIKKAIPILTKCVGGLRQATR